MDHEEVGKLIHNKDPRSFENVKIYAGDSFNDPANARFKNLQYENIEENQIGKRQILNSQHPQSKHSNKHISTTCPKNK